MIQKMTGCRPLSANALSREVGIPKAPSLAGFETLQEIHDLMRPETRKKKEKP